MPSYSSVNSSAVYYSLTYDPDLAPGINDLQGDIAGEIAAASPTHVVNSRYYYRDPSGHFRQLQRRLNRGVIVQRLAEFELRIDRFERRLRRSLSTLRDLDFIIGLYTGLIAGLEYQIRSARSAPIIGVGATSAARSISRAQQRAARRAYIRSLRASIRRIERVYLRPAERRRLSEIRFARSIVAGIRIQLRRANRFLQDVEDEIDSVENGQSYFMSLLFPLAEEIYVTFRGGTTYRWQRSSIGFGNLNTMIQLGESNRGLVSFIQERVKYSYS